MTMTLIAIIVGIFFTITVLVGIIWLVKYLIRYYIRMNHSIK